jgi:Fe2+ or Zn2+ uptake regulation protein
MVYNHSHPIIMRLTHEQFRELAAEHGLAVNNLRLFIECGLLREVTPHASTLRVDGNLKPHHHLVCSRCKSVRDIEGEFIDFKRLSRHLPDGFDLTQPLVEVFGLCRRCAAKK